VDRSGSIVPATVKGFHNLDSMGKVTVQGKVERQGKKVRIRATGIFVG
jgi:hypothetical protein